MEDPNTTTTGLEACAAFNTMERAYIAVSIDFWPTYRKNERRRRSASAFGGSGHVGGTRVRAACVHQQGQAAWARLLALWTPS